MLRLHRAARAYHLLEAHTCRWVDDMERRRARGYLPDTSMLVIAVEKDAHRTACDRRDLRVLRQATNDSPNVT